MEYGKSSWHFAVQTLQVLEHHHMAAGYGGGLPDDVVSLFLKCLTIVVQIVTLFAAGINVLWVTQEHMKEHV